MVSHELPWALALPLMRYWDGTGIRPYPSLASWSTSRVLRSCSPSLALSSKEHTYCYSSCSVWVCKRREALPALSLLICAHAGLARIPGLSIKFRQSEKPTLDGFWRYWTCFSVSLLRFWGTLVVRGQVWGGVYHCCPDCTCSVDKERIKYNCMDFFF